MRAEVVDVFVLRKVAFKFGGRRNFTSSRPVDQPRFKSEFAVPGNKMRNENDVNERFGGPTRDLYRIPFDWSSLEV